MPLTGSQLIYYISDHDITKQIMPDASSGQHLTTVSQQIRMMPAASGIICIMLQLTLYERKREDTCYSYSNKEIPLLKRLGMARIYRIVLPSALSHSPV